MNQAVKVYAVIILISLPTVMYGGFSLLRLLGAGRLDEFQRSMFRAGHAHAGVLLVMTLATLDVLTPAGVGTGVCWAIGGLLAVGAIAQSGGMFLHLAVGRPGRWSAGNWTTSAGAVLLAVGMLWAAVAVAVS